MKKLSAILVLLMVLSSPAFGQGTQGKTKAQLEQEIRALQNEIATANQLLQKTTRDREMTLNEVAILDQKIRQREQLIRVYNEQIAVLDQEINQGQSRISGLNTDLGNLRKEYAKMITFAYKNRSHYVRLGFLFASESFNQAFRRLRYIQQFSDSRKIKMQQIASTEQRLSGEVQANQQAREQQAALLQDEQLQQQALEEERAVLNAQVARLRTQEDRIQQDINSKQQQAQRLQKAIDDIIAEEIRKANEEAERRRREAEARRETPTSTTSSSGTMALTPAEQTLSSNFAGNKGKLPWPVERGVISSSYGRHTSVVSDRVTVTNNGIDIATTEGAQARAVFDGVVTNVTKLSGTNMVVIIRHGEYFTVYSNLESVSVKSGDQVKTKQNIGVIHTNRTENKTELHFELLKEMQRQNPASWLSQ